MRRDVKKRRLEAPERDFRARLIAVLRGCANGRAEDDFGQNNYAVTMSWTEVLEAADRAWPLVPFGPVLTPFVSLTRLHFALYSCTVAAFTSAAASMCPVAEKRSLVL
jgi:hypothetical protein